jgi:pimeloyl-ACP methyl ester carboxylesterase
VTPTAGAGSRLRVRGLELALHAWGGASRPPLLLLHSLAAHSHWWDWLAPLLAARFDVVALDARGHGASAWAEPAAYAFDDYAADTVAVLDALGWPRATLAGHSMGGYVGALVAARHPERVEALVIADMLTGWPPALREFVRAQAERAAPTFASAQEAAERFRLSPPDTSAPADRLRYLGAAGVVERRPGVWEHAFDRRVFLHPAVDPWPFLPDVVCPTLVVHGAASGVMDAEASRRVAATVRAGAALTLPGTHHHLVIEDPEGVARAILEWRGAGR